MAIGLQVWSQTAATNATVDSNINFAEGQAPSSLNDSCRSAMASLAAWRDDNSGVLLTSGTTVAFTVATNQVESALTAGYTLALQFHATADVNATLVADGLAAKPLQIYAGQNLSGQEFQAGSIQRFTYSSTGTGQWISQCHLGLAALPWSTGDVKLTYKTVADTGWVMMNDGSIGDASSGATTLASATTQALFTLFYNNCADADVPVQTSSGGATTRGAQGSAATAFAAHCRMVLPKALGRAASISGAGASLTSRPLGANAGSETHVQTLAELVPHVHGQGLPGGGSNEIGFQSGGTLQPGNTASAGSGSAMSILGPMTFLNIMVAL